MFYHNKYFAKIILIFLTLTSILSVGFCQSKAELQDSVSDSRRNAIVRAVEDVSPGVVNVSTTRIEEVDFFDDPWMSFFFNYDFRTPRRRQLRGLGSGVIINRNGYVLTNQHVIEDADTIKVILSDGREVESQIVGVDFLSDLAVLKVDADDLMPIKWGDSDDLLIGEWAIAIGHPFASAVGNPKPTVTVGVVSATNRTLKTEQRDYHNLIQTDASINPGNSGGPLVNLHGHLIGINTAIYSTSGGSQGIGFAIPAGTAQKVVRHLIEYGVVVPPYLGIEEQALTSELADDLDLKGQIGVLVSSVDKGSPAAKAGIRRRDVIEAIEQQPVPNSAAFRAVTRLLHEDQVVAVQLVRGGKHRTVSLKIEELQWTYTKRDWGITVQQLDRETAQKYARRGVVVTKLERRSRLRELLKRGDLIYQINNFKINSLEDFKRITSQLQRPQRINLLFERNNKDGTSQNLIIRNLTIR